MADWIDEYLRSTAGDEVRAALRLLAIRRELTAFDSSALVRRATTPTASACSEQRLRELQRAVTNQRFDLDATIEVSRSLEQPAAAGLRHLFDPPPL
eukprot:7388681-Prymnesium_polylepis.1